MADIGKMIEYKEKVKKLIQMAANIWENGKMD